VAQVAPAVGPYLLAADLGLLLAAAADFLLTPSPARLSVARRLPERAGLAQAFERCARIEPGPAAGLVLELREEFAPAFEVVARCLGPGELRPPRPGDPTGGPDRARLPSAAIDLCRTYVSRRRGVHALGDLRLRLRGPLGLVWRQARLSGEQRIAIEPPLLGLERTLRLAASERWHDLGLRRLRRRGGLTEFESLREYVHGDDLRLFDWKAFARRGRPIVREFQEERGQELIVLIDVGRRMGTTTAVGEERGWSKLDHALDAGLELAAVALESGDRVGVALFDSRLRVYVAPAKGRRQLGRLREAVFDAQASSRESDVARALRELSVQHRRRALLALITDVADPLSVERQRRALRAGSKRHRIVLATLDDPSIRRAAAGELALEPAVRASALHLVEERARGLRELRRAGLRVLDSLPAEAAGPLLAAWLDARRSGGA